MPIETPDFLTGLLHRHRRAHDRRPFQRAGTAWTQAELVLRWFRDNTRVATLGRDHGLSQATAYRYLHEGIDVLASHALDLHEALAQASTGGLPYLTLDGTLIPTNLGGRAHRGRQPRLVLKASTSTSAATSKVLAAPSGFLLWTSPVEPGSTHDITAAREHCLGALYPMAAAGLPTLAGNTATLFSPDATARRSPADRISTTAPAEHQPLIKGPLPVRLRVKVHRRETECG